jgi:hypothetical protein
VLTWGGAKPDMDLFFVSSGTCRVSYRAGETVCAQNGATTRLDRDSSTGFGPESSNMIFILYLLFFLFFLFSNFLVSTAGALPCGDYVYTVVDSNNPGFFGTAADAEVILAVYTGNSNTATIFKVPQTIPANSWKWNVFNYQVRVSGGAPIYTIVPVNSFSGGPASTPAEIAANEPSKSNVPVPVPAACTSTTPGAASVAVPSLAVLCLMTLIIL